MLYQSDSCFATARSRAPVVYVSPSLRSGPRFPNNTCVQEDPSRFKPLYSTTRDNKCYHNSIHRLGEPRRCLESSQLPHASSSTLRVTSLSSSNPSVLVLSPNASVAPIDRKLEITRKDASSAPQAHVGRVLHYGGPARRAHCWNGAYTTGDRANTTCTVSSAVSPRTAYLPITSQNPKLHELLSSQSVLDDCEARKHPQHLEQDLSASLMQQTGTTGL